MQIIDGKLVASTIREGIKEEVTKLNSLYPENPICLAVVLVGDDPASQIYVRNKIKACEELGMKSLLYKMDATSTTEDVEKVILEMNARKDITGYIIQLPMPKGIDESYLLDLIDPAKDVDGCHYVSKGKLWTGRDSLIACTPYGVMKMLEYYNIPLEGKHAVVVGRSNLVGKPLAQLLLDKNCTVTICHSRTKDLKYFTSQADILCVTVGKAKIIGKDMVKEGAVVVDIGINRDENGKVCGDVDFAQIADKCSYITPVPGGVGPMTITMLMYNTVVAYKMQNNL